MMSSFGMFLQYFIQLGDLPPAPDLSHLSMRVIHLSGTLTGILVFGFYTAILTSYITFADAPRELSQLEDVLALGYNLIVFKESLLDSMLKKVDSD